MFSFILRRLFGTKNARYLKTIAPIVASINALESKVKGLSDDEFIPIMQTYKERHHNGERLDSLLPEVFALVREASLRVLGMRHYDVQLLGGIVLHQGKIAEMKTGEGKTLIATLPASLNALTGKGVHIVTVNDYLAQRDAEWMGKLYSFLGLSCGVIIHGLSDEERREAYNADITYGTNNEFAFDFLRDNMKYAKEHLVQRPLEYAIVDEVDSILIDEARTPLIISGPSPLSSSLYTQLNNVAKQLTLEKDFTLDEKNKSILLTEEGIAKIESLLHIDNLFDPKHISSQHHILQALKALHLYKKDVDYIVVDGKVVIVDEFTGRLMEGRRFGDGLHQAIEAKENVKIEAENQTLANITFQKYFLLYHKLSGMTGTADTEAVEFQQIYGLDVIVIPTNKPLLRIDAPDIIFRTKKEKYNAIVDKIIELHNEGKPVLVGTASIESSELLSSLLQKKHIPHNVLNAKHHEKEAEIIACAGEKGKVTIATNMAGRGTDIVLGEGVLELGGLHILGTERHESRRIDNQLRGRAGRQGDPGFTQFYLSLEDELMRLFGSERISNIMQRLGLEEGESIENRLITRAIENAQKKVEAHYFDMRKSIFEYDNVMNQQREVVYSLRHSAMDSEQIENILKEMIEECVHDIYVESSTLSQEAKEHYENHIEDIFGIEHGIRLSKKELIDAIQAKIAHLKERAGAEYIDIIRFFCLDTVDKAWKDHLLAMEYLREGIGLRGYGQKDPKQEYKKEGFMLFQQMLERIREQYIQILCHLQIDEAEPIDDDMFSVNPLQNTQLHSGTYTVQATPKNAPCPCGSGKKYKRCCGK